MKKLFFLLITGSAFQVANAQTEGMIVYEQKMDMHRRIPKEDEQMRAMIPQFRSSKFELLFADNQSFFRPVEEEQDLSENNGGGGVTIRMMGPADNLYYKNFATQKIVEQRSLADKDYIIEDSIHNLPWKLVDGETKTILGHVCKKATGKTPRGSDVIAWYAEDMSISSGPGDYGGLPGMILGMDLNSAEIVFTAVEIKKDVKKSEVKAPSKGKKVTRTEFEKIQKELFGDGNGPRRVIINN